ncbi:MAG: hypothetical protein H7X94_10120, partial [Vallitaleaceae bacterium]|nr:hypothetical protein [Vallitaleaceae bacterium]
MRLKASYTIEASLIFPVMVLVLVAILFIAIYVHEVTCLQAIANKVVFTAEGQNYELESEQILIDCVEALVQRELIIKEGQLLTEVQISKGFLSNKVEIRITKDFITPFQLLNEYMNHSRLKTIQIKVEASADTFRPANCIRTVDFVDDVSSQIKVTNALK